jgi:hypothetical protein
VIKINILYHFNKKKVKGGSPEILIIIDKIINLLGVDILIHEEKFDEE